VLSMTGQRKINLTEFFTEYEQVKSDQWSYEREWRSVSSARPGESGRYADYRFDPRELRRVIVGPNCSSENELEIASILESRFADATQIRARWDHGVRRIVA
jgi:hypothetical protein